MENLEVVCVCVLERESTAAVPVAVEWTKLREGSTSGSAL